MGNLRGIVQCALILVGAVIVALRACERSERLPSYPHSVGQLGVRRGCRNPRRS